jgi:hypothetical protein
MMSISSTIAALRAVAANEGRVWALLKDGYSVEQAVEQDATLKLALKAVADDYFGQNVDGHAIIAKQVFAPETVTPSEQAWMDRASATV